MALSTDQDDRLYDALADALRSAGFGKLTSAHAWQPPVWDPFPAILATIGAGVGNVAGLVAVGLAWPLAVLAALAIAPAPRIVARRNASEEAIAIVYLAPPVAAGIAVLVEVGWPVLLTNALPFALGILGAYVADRLHPVSPRRTLAAVKGVLTDLPLLFPLVALVLFALIITSEIWQVANTESVVRLAIVAAIVIIPVTWQLRRALASEIEPLFEQTAAETLAHADPATAVSQALHTDKRDRALTDAEKERIAAAFTSADAAELDKLACDELVSTFRRRVTTRLLLTVVLVGLTAFLLIFGLTWLTVEEQVASSWAGAGDQPTDLPYWEPFGLQVPLGPYVKVSALLAILAVAVFIAFVTTNKDLFDRFRAAYIERPAATAMLLVVPYRAERDALEPAAAQSERLTHA